MIGKSKRLSIVLRQLFENHGSSIPFRVTEEFYAFLQGFNHTSSKDGNRRVQMTN